MLANRPAPKLQSYWHYHDCGYRKIAGTCNEPGHFSACPLPLHPLRNGRLNQTAYGLFLFIRDLADGDLVAWIDRRLTNRYFMAVASQGVMQVATIVIMARLATGI